LAGKTGSIILTASANGIPSSKLVVNAVK